MDNSACEDVEVEPIDELSNLGLSSAREIARSQRAGGWNRLLAARFSFLSGELCRVSAYHALTYQTMEKLMQKCCEDKPCQVLGCERCSHRERHRLAKVWSAAMVRASRLGRHVLSLGLESRRWEGSPDDCILRLTDDLQSIVRILGTKFEGYSLVIDAVPMHNERNTMNDATSWKEKYSCGWRFHLHVTVVSKHGEAKSEQLLKTNLDSAQIEISVWMKTLKNQLVVGGQVTTLCSRDESKRWSYYQLKTLHSGGTLNLDEYNILQRVMFGVKPVYYGGIFSEQRSPVSPEVAIRRTLYALRRHLSSPRSDPTFAALEDLVAEANKLRQREQNRLRQCSRRRLKESKETKHRAREEGEKNFCKRRGVWIQVRDLFAKMFFEFSDEEGHDDPFWLNGYLVGAAKRRNSQHVQLAIGMLFLAALYGHVKKVRTELAEIIDLLEVAKDHVDYPVLTVVADSRSKLEMAKRRHIGILEHLSKFVPAYRASEDAKFCREPEWLKEEWRSELWSMFKTCSDKQLYVCYGHPNKGRYF